MNKYGVNYLFKILQSKILLALSVAFLYSCNENKITESIADSTTIVTKTEQTVIPVGKGPDALFLTPNKSFLYVANVEDTLVSIISTKTEKVVQIIPGIINPWGFTRIAHSNNIAISTYDKQLVIVDFTSHKIIDKKNFNTHLGGITSDRNGRYIFVVSIDNNRVFQLDANSLDLIKPIYTGKGPDGVGISGDESTLFVTNTEDGTISVVDIISNDQKVINTGGKPELIHSNRDNSLLYVSNFLKNKIHIIDTERKEIIKEIENISTPEEAVLSADEKLLYVVSFELSEISVYDALTLEKLPITYKTGKNPIGVIPYRKKLYVSNYGDNSISIINK
ncbi:MAG: YncE family protein [Bacteroidetes bacterium]|nr:YncE family protein [Bacteroidota bacterium]